MSTVTLPSTRAPADAPRLQAWGFHLGLLALMVAVQVAMAPSRPLGADNTWHFQFARDVVSGVPVYWSAVDANRLFPDLVLSVVACFLPNGRSFAYWTTYFYALLAAAMTLGLQALVAALFPAERERRLALVLAVSGLFLFMVVFPFWDVWLMLPGNHGAGVPVCFACLAILLHMNKAERADPLLAALFVVLAASLIASNRYLLIAFFAPLFFALLLGWLLALRWPKQPAAAGGTMPPGGSRHRLLVLSLLTLGAIAYGNFGWTILGQLNWHKLVQLGGMPPAPKSDYLLWFEGRTAKFATEFWASTQEEGAVRNGWSVPAGVLALAAAVLAAALLLVAAMRERVRSLWAENRRVFAFTAAGAALLSLAFVAFFTEGSGSWQFRFLAVPVAVAVPLLCALAVPFVVRRLPAPAIWVLALGAGLLLLAVAFAVSSSRRGPIAAEEARFAQAIADLEGRLRQRSSATPMRGLSEYWIANDVTTRSRVLQIEPLEPEKGEYRFYNNNAEHLCHSDFFYVLQDARKDEPRLSALTAILGEPLATDTINLVRFPEVKILFYDPKVVAERMIAAAQARAPQLFPTFACPR